jgi:hypothetical protein
MGQQSPPIEFEYSAPSGCGSEHAVIDKLEKALEGQVRDPIELSASVDVTKDGDVFRLEFEATRDSHRSRRTLLLDSCEAVTEASALLLLLTIDPVLADTIGATELVESTEAGTSGEPAAEPDPRPEPDSDPRPEPDSDSDSDSDSDLQTSPERPSQRQDPKTESESDATLTAPDSAVRGAWIALGPTASMGLAASTAFGVGAEGGVSTRTLAFSGGVSWLSALDADIPGVDGARVESTQLRALARAALVFGPAAARYGPYLGLSLDRVSADSRGVSAPGGGGTQWFSLLAGVSLDTKISGGWALALRGGIAIPTERPSFTVSQVRTVAHRPSVVAGEAFLGVLWGWGSQSP